MRTLCLLPIFILFIVSAFGQKHDYFWLMGQNSQVTPEYAGTVIDFNATPPDIYYEFRDMYFRQVNASICDTAGNLLFYTNGIYIANALNEPMENGQGLNPGLHAQQNQQYGYILDQGAIILPVPEKDNLYYLLHFDKELTDDMSDLQSANFRYSLINMNENNGTGKVMDKNIIIKHDNFQLGKLTAAKHANGRDWWILLRKYAATEFYRFLITPFDIVNYPIQQIGNSIPRNGVGQAVFSPAGDKFAVYETLSIQEGHYLNLYDFDRCTGDLMNPLQFHLVDTAWAGGAAFSPSGRFLYTPSFKYVYQYDLHAPDIEASRITVAEWDGFEENGSFATTFYLAQLAPDGKIYINSNNSVSYLHVINNPDLPGLLCDVCQHCVDLPTKNSFSLPNFPNYRLHHLEGSPCDTLRQPPTAAWSYNAQALELAFQDSSYHDIRAWHWDFGDGVIDTVPHPVHTYAAEGVYNVCLAVNNLRGIDTLCQEVQVIVNGIDEVEGGISASISPNPVGASVTANLFADLGASANKFAVTASLRDALGREVLREPLRVVNGKVQQKLKIGHLAAGVYFCVIEDAGVVVWQGKVIK